MGKVQPRSPAEIRRRRLTLLVFMLLVCNFAVDALVLRKMRAAKFAQEPRTMRVETSLGPQLPSEGLRDQFDRPFRLTDAPARWSLLFFGFTRCPDVCPATMQILAEAWRQLDDAPKVRERSRVVLVSVDPTDDAASLRTYVGAFDPSFIGVRGEETAVATLTSKAGVLVETRGMGIEHSGAVLLVDPSGRAVRVFTPPLDASELATALRSSVER